MQRLRRLGVLLIVVACLGGGSAARDLSVVALLDAYAAGQFEAVLTELDRITDFNEVLTQLKRDGPVWIEAGGEADRPRRQLVAATLALEAARADEWYEWKWLTRVPDLPLVVLTWKPPPLLIEWGCALMRTDESPRPIERWWQLAALSVAQRSEDVSFLVGDPYIGRGGLEIMNVQDEIKHLDHVQKRFPGEPRFVLAQGIARDPMWEDDATKAYLSVIDDQDVGGEAAMRLGAMSVRRGRTPQATTMLDRAERLTRDPYVIYLARYFRAQLYERQKDTPRAQAAYRSAVAAWPHAQSATLALAASLFREERRTEAYGLVGAMLDAGEPLFDPWREYVHADNRFWPLFIGKLRAEIRR